MKYNHALFTIVRDNQKARERKYKNRTIAYVLRKKYPVIENIELDVLEKIVKNANSIDRQWRKLLEEYPEFRGKDYGEKLKVVNKKLVELGYKSK